MECRTKDDGRGYEGKGKVGTAGVWRTRDPLSIVLERIIVAVVVEREDRRGAGKRANLGASASELIRICSRLLS